jgi:hypothetical protein
MDDASPALYDRNRSFAGISAENVRLGVFGGPATRRPRSPFP